MLSRLILRNKAGSEERLRFGKLAFGSRRAQSTPEEEYVAAAKEMLAESGLEELERKVLGLVYGNSGNLQLLSVLADTSRLLHQVWDISILLVLVPGSYEMFAHKNPDYSHQRRSSPGQACVSVGSQRGYRHECGAAAGRADTAGGGREAAE